MRGMVCKRDQEFVNLYKPTTKQSSRPNEGSRSRRFLHLLLCRSQGYLNVRAVLPQPLHLRTIPKMVMIDIAQIDEADKSLIAFLTSRLLLQTHVNRGLS